MQLYPGRVAHTGSASCPIPPRRLQNTCGTTHETGRSMARTISGSMRQPTRSFYRRSMVAQKKPSIPLLCGLARRAAPFHAVEGDNNPMRVPQVCSNLPAMRDWKQIRGRSLASLPSEQLPQMLDFLILEVSSPRAGNPGKPHKVEERGSQASSTLCRVQGQAHWLSVCRKS